LLAPLNRLLSAFDALKEWHVMLLDPPAARAFEAFRVRLHEEMRRADGIEAAWLGKGGGMVASLVGVFALMSWAACDTPDLPAIVGVDAVERAVSLWWDYYRPHATALFSREGTSEESRARRVVRWLRAGGRDVISLKDVRRSALREAVDAREADEVIDRLVDAGALRPRPRVKTDRPGRPALRWDVNPLIAHLPPCAKCGEVPSSYEGGGVMSSSVDAHDPSDAARRRHLPNCVGEESEVPRTNRPNRPNPQTH
jgi:hypothetical protein